MTHSPATSEQQRAVYGMDDAAERLGIGRRTLQDWLKAHPFDGRGEPFYSPFGNRKTFDEGDIERIRAAAREEEACRLSSKPRGRAARRTTASAASSSASESVERSAVKHRGRPCHLNTRAAAVRTHRGVRKTAEHCARIAAGKQGKPRSEATKAKIRASWAKRRDAGEFKTAAPYAHRKMASAMIAKIPQPLGRHISATFRAAGDTL